MEKFYITTNQNAANQLIDYLNTEVIKSLNEQIDKVYTVEEVDETYTERKFKVYSEDDVFKGYVRIIKKPKLTTSYAEVIVHKDGGQYAIPIIDLTYHDVEADVVAQALPYGYIHNGALPNDWFEEII